MQTYSQPQRAAKEAVPEGTSHPLALGDHMRLALLSITLWLLAGCIGEPPGDTPCESQRGYLEICATEGGAAAAGAAWIRADSTDESPLQALFDQDGCVTVELSPGQHEWSARDSSGFCASPYEQVSIGACEEVTQVSIELIDWCMDGR